MEDKRRSAVTSAPLRVQLLGGFQVWVDGEPISATAWRRKSVALVKLLALSPEHRLHREEVLEHLWPDLPSKAAINNLHVTLHSARRSLESPTSTSYLRFDGEMLVLDPSYRVCVDLILFIRKALQARRTQELEDYEGALELYHGELLPEDRYQDWTVSCREELHHLHLELALELAELYQKENKHWDALELLRNIVTEEPTLEAAHLAIMHLHVRMGQPHSAVMAFEKVRRTLRREFGSRPGREVRRLYQAILERLTHETSSE